MRRLLQYAFALFACIAVPAMAADGFVTGNVNLRAGPDTEYPIITVVPLGTNVSIQGCTEGFAWCDVVTMGTRGWVSGGYIQYTYQDQRVVVQDYGARIGIPVISFVIGSYWGSYYQDRPFYRQRDYWYHRPWPSHHRPPVRPRPPSWSGGHRPNPGNGTRPPRPGHGGSGGTRPPNPGNGGGTRPPNPGNGGGPGGGTRPPNPGNGSGGGTRPPRPGNGSGGGTRPPAPGNGQKPAPRPQTRPLPTNTNGN
ncbi:Uncharacterized conserved protein YraI [Dyella sp. OK004]|uniref:SH3 domain-containing protein n=1 Tax=Dyella sp. OK004 TaxID=1855292 RepID=UPI0008E2731A|nr:SH3 domain-containing protein [Dyella sp. OK004]SFS02156.1 Uncharacterized conserved protein YraI [Dyella sp. OK004]